MRCTATVLCALAVLGATLWLSGPGQGQPEPRPLAPAATDRPDERKDPANADPVAALSRRVNFAGISDPKANLEDALKTLSRLYHVPFDVNEMALKADGVDPRAVEPFASGELPPADNVRLDQLLKRLLRRVPANSGATFLVRADSIEITTNAFVKPEVWGDEFDGPFLPLVHLHADKVPLNEALARLAEQGRFNIVCTAPPEMAGMPVTIRLTNAPLDTAVRLLALKAGLSVVHRDNVLVVTTPENAAALAAEFHAEAPEAGPKYRRGSIQPPATPPNAN